MGNDNKKEADINWNDPKFQPQGLYASATLKWDKRVLAKLIIDKKLAGYQKGLNDADPSLPDLEECPICFLFYNGGLNRSVCCGKGICTECFVHVCTPGNPSPTICPFCQAPAYSAEFRGPLTQEVREKDKAEEIKVKEIELRMRLEEIEQDRKRDEEKKRRLSQANTPTSGTPATSTPAKSPAPQITRAGSQPVVIKPRVVPEATSTPMNSVVSPSSLKFPQDLGGTTEAELFALEEKMLQEAIRLSLETDSVKK